MKTLRPICLGLSLIAVLLISSPLTAEGFRITEVSSLYNFWDRAYNSVVVDDYAYVATGSTGLRILNVSNPNNLFEIGFNLSPKSAREVAVINNHAFVVDAPNSLQIIDVTNPSDPISVAFYEVPGITCVAVTEDYAFISGSDLGLRIIDISDPTDPRETDHLDAITNALSIDFENDFIYIFNNRCILQIINFTDPRDPYITSQIVVPPGYILRDGGSISAVDNLVFCCTGNLSVVDVTEPENPQLAGSIHTPGTARSVAISNDIAYIADRMWGISVFDVSDPANMQQISGLVPALAYGITISNDFAYVTLPGSYDSIPQPRSGVHIIDISDPAHPSNISEYTTPRNISKVTLDKSLNYYHNYAYVLIEDAGLRIIDITDSENMREVGQFNINYLAADLVVNNGIAYLLSGWREIVILDVSDPLQPTEISTIETQNTVKIAFDSGFLYLADVNELRIFDVSDLNNPHQLGSCQIDDWPINIKVRGDYVFLTLGFSGLNIVDVSDRSNPQIVGRYNENPMFITDIGIRMFSNHAFLGTQTEGITVIDISDPTEPQFVYRMNVPFNIHSIEYDYYHLYISALEDGLQLIRDEGYRDAWFNTPGSAQSSACPCDGALTLVADGFSLRSYDTSVTNVPSPDQPNIPTATMLLDPYPNPFNASTNISWQLLLPGAISLDAYDLAGRRIAVLYNSFFSSPGTYNLIWDANELPSGSYFIRLNSNGTVHSKEVKLLR